MGPKLSLSSRLKEKRNFIYKDTKPGFQSFLLQVPAVHILDGNMLE